MTKREISKYNSFAQIASALEVHAPVYSEHVQLVKGADDFAGFLERLDLLSTRQSAQTGGAAKDKARALQLLGNQAFKVAAGLATCAHDNENGDLAGRVAYSRSHISRGPEAVIISRCRGL